MAKLVVECCLCLCLLIVFIGFANAQQPEKQPKNCSGVTENESPFFIIIDGGSTGSRLHIFEFVEDEDGLCSCLRRGSSRANVPLSAFKPDPCQPLNGSYVAEHMLPPFEFAAEVVPEQYHATTTVKYGATAGMRLLSEEEQEAVYDALFQGLKEADSFVFTGMKRADIATLSGDLEGYYGVVAANYLSRIIDANLYVIPKEGEEQEHFIEAHSQSSSDPPSSPIGALDMGGSSTQIVYLTEPVDNSSHNCSGSGLRTGNNSVHAEDDNSVEEYVDDEDYDPQTCRLSDLEGVTKLRGENFFSTSYLSYGADQFRERLWNTLISDRQALDNRDSCDTKMIAYPCGFKGHQIDYEGYTFLGTGETHECIKQVQRLIPHPHDPIDNHEEHAGKTVGGIQHPPVAGKFFAMSLYFFTLDSLRVLSHTKKDAHEALNSAWPRPTIEELFNALEGLCSRSWTGDLEDIKHDAHDFTSAEVLPHRCFESVYMVTLLRDGFGFRSKSRDITFTFLVDGSEVEWSLGMALTLFSGRNETHERCIDQDLSSISKAKTRRREENAEQFDAMNGTRSFAVLANGNSG